MEKITKVCKTHGETTFAPQKSKSGYTYYCVKCSAARKARWQKKNKEEAVAYKGGKCEHCGYNKCLGALHFHHLDPTEKDFASFSTFKLEKSKSELDKCILLCANCHAEVHYYLQVS